MASRLVKKTGTGKKDLGGNSTEIKKKGGDVDGRERRNLGRGGLPECRRLLCVGTFNDPFGKSVYLI